MAAHWGTFNKNYDHRTCLSMSSTAVSDYALQIYDNAWDGDYIVIGGGRGDLVVQVTCVPQGGNNTWIAVTAWASDSGAAEQARNTIREQIVRMVNID
ncbi:hypothetical protein JOF56_006094 [Kibdelosporangium banguiense]|uniref:Uncharacterized protein n=1 Tax=Kibdelosporangium banguiense TaxID=1365924 RepID=A0ABS4TMW9_9PSEU|nr:hypothetical protein [Kibdelosporangium banguiense]MBP2325709.1 hypothetical protein [Kibdelosporangium banguiense]